MCEQLRRNVPGNSPCWRHVTVWEEEVELWGVGFVNFEAGVKDRVMDEQRRVLNQKRKK